MRGGRSQDVVALLAKAPVPGRVKTRLAQEVGDEAAAALARAMLLDLVREHEEREYDLVVACKEGELAYMTDVLGSTTILETEGSELRGPSSALLGLFGSLLGRYRRAVVLCADTPFATCGRVRHALSQLGAADLVVGPGVTGGYYLIGMQRLIDVFSDHRAGRYPYLGQTLVRAESLGVRYRVVGPEWDVDTVEDVRCAPWSAFVDHLDHTIPALKGLGLSGLTI
jgi:uncharacterized protein